MTIQSFAALHSVFEGSISILLVQQDSLLPVVEACSVPLLVMGETATENRLPPWRESELSPFKDGGIFWLSFPLTQDRIVQTLHRLFQWAEDRLDLTEKEEELLLSLHRHGGEPLSRQRLLTDVWQMDATLDTHTVETHIYRLRQKLADHPLTKSLKIETTEHGYLLHLSQNSV